MLCPFLWGGILEQKGVDWPYSPPVVNDSSGCPCILQEAVKNCQYWRLRDSHNKPPGVIGYWPNRAVTFIDNHDTGARPFSPWGCVCQTSNGVDCTTLKGTATVACCAKSDCSAAPMGLKVPAEGFSECTCWETCRTQAARSSTGPSPAAMWTWAMHICSPTRVRPLSWHCETPSACQTFFTTHGELLTR